VIVVDTGGLVALLDADDKHHAAVVDHFDADGAEWVLPWAILPEVDYLAATRLGEKVARAFAEDLSRGIFTVEGVGPKDLSAAWALMKKYPRLPLGLVDAVVMVQAERLKARAIVTLDARHFRAVKLAGNPKLIPLDD
jgi:predicted nucleic acid-binding protein